MSFEVIATPRFKRDVKNLHKKYPSIKADFLNLIELLEQSPEQGSPLGNHCFKIRLAITSKGKEKSGGARVITCVKIVNQIVYLLSIYDKSEKENISDRELLMMLEQIP